MVSLEEVQGVVQGLDLRVVSRVLEFVFSLIGWSVMSAAHRSGYEGYFQYDNYTPLNFLLAVGVIHWGFVMAVVALKVTGTLDPESYDKMELYGSGLLAAFTALAAVAGAASSSQLHDKFGSYATSVCKPKPHATSAEKTKAAYFCSHVDAAVVFTWFAATAAATSFYMVFKSQRQNLMGDGDGSVPNHRPDAYNPIGAAANDQFHFHSPGVQMDGLGSDSMQQPRPEDSAVDL